MTVTTEPKRHSGRHVRVFAGLAVMAAVSCGVGEAQAIDHAHRYCISSWRNAGIPEQEWEECTQQALVDLLTRGGRSGLTEAMNQRESGQRRELNRAIWATVQRFRRRKKLQQLPEDVLGQSQEQWSLRENVG